MAAMAFYWGGRMAWVSEMISFAYIAIACVFLVVPWLRRMSMDQVVRYLEKQSVPNIDAQNRQGNLKQLMRTYLYYHKTTTQPALFDWIRRQLSLYMLGIDVRSYIPFSIDSMIRRAVKMLLYVAVLTLFLFLTRDKENAWEGFEIADGEVPAGIVATSAYQGAEPDPADPSRPFANEPGTSDITRPEQAGSTPGENSLEADLESIRPESSDPQYAEGSIQPSEEQEESLLDKCSVPSQRPYSTTLKREQAVL